MLDEGTNSVKNIYSKLLVLGSYTKLLIYKEAIKSNNINIETIDKYKPP